ncbi:F0F1 ATP synthase subunit epsilon [Dendrosporobacter sp. 1207_IL3150]|uniref:F0F1 ATP synthase subunit epsilon n=1 Tax=Dendrosporobacter sp. 1207_IL3150 TaxID=3084054 RepID=UPI002FD8DC9E
MAKKIRLDIVSPERVVYSADVNMVIARTTDGDIGVLPGHTPLIAGLQIWPLRLLTDEGEKQVSVCSGFIEVQPEKVTVLAACAELPEEIDVGRAEAAKSRAEARLKADKEAREKVDTARAEAALKRALLRLQLANRGKI